MQSVPLLWKSAVFWKRSAVSVGTRSVYPNEFGNYTGRKLCFEESQPFKDTIRRLDYVVINNNTIDIFVSMYFLATKI